MHMYKTSQSVGLLVLINNIYFQINTICFVNMSHQILQITHLLGHLLMICLDSQCGTTVLFYTWYRSNIPSLLLCPFCKNSIGSPLELVHLQVFPLCLVSHKSCLQCLMPKTSGNLVYHLQWMEVHQGSHQLKVHCSYNCESFGGKVEELSGFVETLHDVA